MAKRVTLQELQDVADPLIHTDDFTNLANRAVRRLYTRAATPGMLVEFIFAEQPTVLPPPSGNPVSEGYRNLPDVRFILPAEFDHAALFKVDGSNETRSVIPLSETYKSDHGYDTNAFVDYGQWEDESRIYGAPYDVEHGFDNNQLSYENVKALCRLSYVPVSNTSDEFPFDNVGALKLACLATVYEDENDLERADQYWQYAIRELDEESQRYRGPQKMTLAYSDPAAYDVTQPIN